MAADYRYWCGECGYRTPWLTRAGSAEQRTRHYAECHPGVPPRGQAERRRSASGGVGCLVLVGVLLLIVVAVAVCRYQFR
ncbi:MULTISPECIES: hypothetical protein [Amycolatopsis]|uniref:Uncharacterized protein n=1 Tax=Amycolatopsis albidoflavus TaxID=102226 RepID=A0ABW5I5M7_9PSEU